MAAGTAGKLKNLMEQEYIVTHARALVDMEGSGLYYLLENDRYDDLKRIYSLLSRVPVLLELIRDYIGDLYIYIIIYICKCNTSEII